MAENATGRMTFLLDISHLHAGSKLSLTANLPILLPFSQVPGLLHIQRHYISGC